MWCLKIICALASIPLGILPDYCRSIASRIQSNCVQTGILRFGVCGFWCIVIIDQVQLLLNKSCMKCWCL